MDKMETLVPLSEVPGEKAIHSNKVSVHNTLFKNSIDQFERRITSAYGPLRLLIPSISVDITDNTERLLIRRGKVVMQHSNEAPIADISAHSDKILHWFNHPYGTDTFVVGAHFGILRDCTQRLKLFFALLLLAEAHIAPRYMLRTAFWKFLWRRKHELLASIISLRVTSSYQ